MEQERLPLIMGCKCLTRIWFSQLEALGMVTLRTLPRNPEPLRGLRPGGQNLKGRKELSWLAVGHLVSVGILLFGRH